MRKKKLTKQNTPTHDPAVSLRPARTGGVRDSFVDAKARLEASASKKAKTAADASGDEPGVNTEATSEEEDCGCKH